MEVLKAAGSLSGFILIEDSFLQSSYPLIKDLKNNGVSDDDFVGDLTETLIMNGLTVELSNRLKDAKLIYGSVQTDMLSFETVKGLEYLANTIIKIQPIDGPNSPSNAHFELVTRKPGGRISYQVYGFEINDGCMAKVRPIDKSKKVTVSIKTKGPHSTFNLGLSEEQKAVKDSIILPYMRMNLNEEEGHDKTEARPVLADDFDDEDPDDDLDI